MLTPFPKKISSTLSDLQKANFLIKYENTANVKIFFYYELFRKKILVFTSLE